MSTAIETVYEDQTYFENYEVAEEAVLEDILQEMEEKILENELAIQNNNLSEIGITENDTDVLRAEGGDTSQEEEEDSGSPETLTTEVYENNTDEVVDLIEESDLIEIADEDVFEDFNDFSDQINAETLVKDMEEQDAIPTVLEEFERELAVEEDLQREQDEIEEQQEAEEIDNIAEIDDNKNFIEFEEEQETKLDGQIDLKEKDNVEDLEHQEDQLELEDNEEEVTSDEFTESINKVEEDVEQRNFEQDGQLDLFKEKEEEVEAEEALIGKIIKNLDIENENITDELKGSKEEFKASTPKVLKELDLNHSEEEQIATVKEICDPDEIVTLEKELSQVSDEYQSDFTPQEQFLALLAADLSILEIMQSENEHNIFLNTVAEKSDLPSPSLLPHLSFDKEIISLEEELARLAFPCPSQHFHEQLHEPNLQLLEIDTSLNLDKLDLISQYDFLTKTESYENDKASIINKPIKKNYTLDDKILKAEFKISPKKGKKSQSDSQDQKSRISRKRKWTEREIQILKKNSSLPDKNIATMLNRTINAIRLRRIQLGIRKKTPKIYSINLKFFQEWSRYMAYVLGYIYADGSIRNRKTRMELNIKSKDLNILIAINKAMESNYKIKKEKLGKGFIYRLGIYQKKIVEDLLELGLVPRKAMKMIFPKIPKGFESHFIRGYFDGDGHVGIAKDNTLIITFTSANKKFLEGVNKELKENLILGTSLTSRKNNSFYVLSVLKKSREDFYSFLYKHAAIYMERKKDVFDKYFNSLSKKQVIKCIDCGGITLRMGKNHKRCSDCKIELRKWYYRKKRDK